MATIDFSRLAADAEDYVLRAQEEAILAASKAAQAVYQRTIERARQDEHWVHLADNIHMWSQDGQLVIGLLHQDFVSQAMHLEYGDEHTPPSPLFRTMGPDQDTAQDIIREHMQSAYGYGVQTGEGES